MKEGAALITEWANDQIRKRKWESHKRENFAVDDIGNFWRIYRWVSEYDEEITVVLT